MRSGGKMKIVLNTILQALEKEKNAHPPTQASRGKLCTELPPLLIDIHNPLQVNLDDFTISGNIKTNSKKVKEGDIFSCIKGFNVDGHAYANEVINKGAKILIVEEVLDQQITQILVSDTRKATAIIAKIMYDNPSEKFDLIGVTGTNGKTSTTMILEHLLQNIGYKTGLIGTLGYKIGDVFYPSEHTTPDIIELNEIFLKMSLDGCQIVIMEVSSHSLSLERVYGLNFKIGIFTNLSQDHLDFHQNMEEYGNAKLKLFKMVEANNGINIINTDDNFGKAIYENLNSRPNTYGIHKDRLDNFWMLGNISLSNDHTTFTLCSNKAGHTFEIHSLLIGKFNVYNLAGALIAFLIIKNKTMEALRTTLNKSEHLEMNFPTNQNTSFNIPGRMEKILNEKDVDIYLDYAHTPEALSLVLDAVREVTQKRIICVWGCGGNRDKEKRHLMSRISIEKADLSIITTDNPRFEIAADIIRDIVNPLSFTDPYIIISDRKEAIKAAINLAQKGDTVLIAGKGHETYQEIGAIKHHFDDKEEIVKWKHECETLKDKLAIPIDILNLEKLIDIKIENNVLANSSPLFTSISTDSRTTESQTLFFGIKGKQFNGADFINIVLNKSESNWVITQKTDDKMQNTKNTIFTSDPIGIYGKLAQKYLKLFGAKIIAITGSTGKTTTKEILYNILSTNYMTYKSYANENNNIGVPKNIFKMSPLYEYAIFEIGTSGIGEIANLANIIRADCGGIISINASHLKFLKTLEQVHNEKMSLIHHLKDFFVIPDKPLLSYPHSHISSPTAKAYTFGMSKDADFRIAASNIGQKGLNVKMKMKMKDQFNTAAGNLNPVKYNTSIKVPFLIENISFAIAISKLLGINDDTINKGLQKELFLENRMEVVNSSKNTIIFDCYNANPCSMKAAIEYWKNTKPKKTHIAILGDMLELGKNEQQYHKEIGKILSKIRHTASQPLSIEKTDINTGQKNILIIGIGMLAKYYKPDVLFENVDAFINELSHSGESKSSATFKQINKKTLSKSIILIKGSNSINLKKLKGRI